MKNAMTAICSCGSVEIEAIGKPIWSIVCYCDDCQKGSRQIEALPNAGSTQDPDGGTRFLLYRKDRVKITKGDALLKDLRLQDKSPTKRVVAGCCNSGMFLNFEKGHWLSMYHARFQGDLPPLQMRIQTKHRPEGSPIPPDAPIYKAFPLKFITKLMAARLAMLVGR